MWLVRLLLSKRELSLVPRLAACTLLVAAIAIAPCGEVRAEPPTAATVVVPQLDDPTTFARPDLTGAFSVERTAGGLRVRDVRRTLIGRTIPRAPGAGDPLAVSPDGRTVLLESMTLVSATASTARQLDASRSARQASFDESGRRVVIATEDRSNHGRIEIWNVASGTLERSVDIPVESSGFNSLAIDRSGRRGVFRVAVGGGKTRAEMWSLDTGKRLAVLEDNPSLGNVSGIAMALDGRRAVVAHMTRLVYWDLDKHTVLARPEPAPPFRGMGFITHAVAVAADGSAFAAADLGSKNVRIFDERGRRVASLPISASTLAFDGRDRLVTDGKRAWSASDGRSRGRAAPAAGGPLLLGAAHRSATVFTLADGGDLTAWSLDALRPLWTTQAPARTRGTPSSLSVTPDDGSLLVRVGSRSLILDARTGKPATAGASSPNPQHAHSKEAHLVATANNDHDVVVTDETTHDTLATFRCDGCLLLGKATVAGRYVVATKKRAKWDEPVTLLRWDLDAPSSSPQEAVLATDQHVVYHLTASAEGSVYVTFGTGAVVQFESKTMSTVRTLPRHDSSPRGTLVRGNLVVIADDDGSFRVSRGASAWVTVVRAGGEWVMAADDGTFDGSRGAGLLLAAAGPHGTYLVDQAAVAMNRPDRLLELLRLGAPELIGHYHARHLQRLRKLGLTEADVAAAGRGRPEVRIDDVLLAGHTAKLDVSVSSPRGLARLNLFVDDVPVLGPAGRPLSGARARETIDIALAAGTHKLEVSAVDHSGFESLRAFREVEVSGAAQRGDLYYLGLGVSRYRKSAYDLGYPAKDAVDLGDVLEAGAGTFKAVHAKTLVDDEVSKDTIAAAKDFFSRAKPEDTVVLFVAGHGVHARDAAATYYFVAHDTEARTLATTGVPFEMLEDLLQGIKPTKKLFLLDTCESGEVDVEDTPRAKTTRSKRTAAARQLVLEGAPSGTQAPAVPLAKLREERFIYNDLARRSGAVVFSSSRGSESSLEDDSIRNGYFTEAVMEALVTDRADENHDGDVSTDELRHFVTTRVATMTGGQQNPVVDRDNLSVRFGLPVVASAAPILTRAQMPARPPVRPLVRARPRPVSQGSRCGCEVVGSVSPWGAGAPWALVVGLLLGVRRLRRSPAER